MATTGTYVTPEGIEVKLGKHWVRRDRDQSRGKINSISGSEYVEIEIDFSKLPDTAIPNYNIDRDNDGVLDGYSSNEARIPAFASIIGATVFVREAVTGTGTVDIGLFQQDGTAVDADGLFAALTQAEIDTVGKRAVGAGVNTVPATSSVGATPVTVGVTADPALTGGVVQIMVEYSLNTQD